MQIQDSNSKLKEGVAAWNAWHQEQLLLLPPYGKSYIYLRPDDLSGADLRGANFKRTSFLSANLQGANLSGANFREADLRLTDCRRANFSNTCLYGARCAFARFTGANFTGADLSGAQDFCGDFSCIDFSGANLSHAHFFRTKLKDADFTGAILYQARFNGARMDGTVLADVDLSRAIGLEQVRHLGPSLLDTNTILKSRGDIPHPFLEGCGLSDEYIRNIPSLISDLEPADSCLVYYSDEHNDFVRRLYSSIWEAKARCGLLEAHLIDQWKSGINPGMKGYNRLIVVLSKRMTNDKWLDPLVKKAVKREIKWKRPVLFPVQLDDSELKIETGWAAGMYYTHPPIDFRGWKDPRAYQRALDGFIQAMGIRQR